MEKKTETRKKRLLRLEKERLKNLTNAQAKGAAGGFRMATTPACSQGTCKEC